MNTRHLLTLLATGTLLVLSARAQVFIGSDDFNDNSLTLMSVTGTQAAGQWRLSSPGTGGAFTETNGRMEYSNSTTTGRNYGALYWITPGTSTNSTGNQGLSSGAPFTSSWSSQVSITNTTAPATGYTLAGMEIYSASSIGNGFNGYYGIYLSNSLTNGNRLMIEWGKTSDGSSANFTRTPTFVNIGDNTDVTVRATFDGSAKTLTFDYSTNGSTFTSAGVSYDLDGAQAGLAVPLNDGLGINLVGFSNDDAGAIAGTDMYFDNMSVSAIPEPSTYAALAGLGALGLALWRRRQAKLAA